MFKFAFGVNDLVLTACRYVPKHDVHLCTVMVGGQTVPFSRILAYAKILYFRKGVVWQCILDIILHAQRTILLMVNSAIIPVLLFTCV